jgi:hypothetical protein
MSGVSRSNRKARAVAVSRVGPGAGTAWDRAAFVLGVLLFVLSVVVVRMMMQAEPIVHGLDARQGGAAEALTSFATS